MGTREGNGTKLITIDSIIISVVSSALRFVFAHNMRLPLSTFPLLGLGGDGHSVGSEAASLAEEVNALNEMGARGEIEWAALKALLVKVNDNAG